MFCGVNRGIRANVASKREIETKIPSVIRSGVENPAIVRFFTAIRRSRGTRISSSLAITFDREGKTATAAMARRATKYSTNPATAQNQLAGVKHRALAGSDGTLGF